MHHVRFFVFAAALSVAGCSGELDPNASTVELEGPPDWQLVLTIETALDSDSGNLETSLTAALLDASRVPPFAVTLQLDAGDSLQATDGVQIIDFEPLEDEERVYESTFPMEVIGQDLTISLFKSTPPVDVDWWVPTDDSPEPDFSDFFIDAPNTQVRLPQPFTIDAPAYDPDPTAPDDGLEEFALGSNVSLVWTPNNSGEDMRLVYTSRCGNSFSPLGVVDIEGDPGLYEAPVDDFLDGHSNAAIQDPGGCIIRLTLERETDNSSLTPDPALSPDSNLVARHRRFIEIKSVP